MPGRNIINCNQKITIFKLSDYDLDDDERKEKYKDYDLILCEKCNQRIINHYWYCKKCYNNEDDDEKYRMLHGRCKGCSRVMKIRHWCSSCNSKRFQRDFNNWTSGNEDIDRLIKDSQTSAFSKHILEWIPYNRFTNIEYIAEGGFAKVYSATWEDGRIEKWDQGSNNKWKRSRSFKVALKVLNKKDKNNLSFLNELNFLKNFPSFHFTRIIECYGITQEPDTLNYALVLKLKDCSLRSYLGNHYNTLTLKDKLDIIGRICLGLNCIHSHNIIHRDLHPGNILYSFNKKSNVFISDFGFCKPAYEISNSNEEICGVMPYVAPEIWNGEEYTKESDIYSFGIIINEIISGNQPFNDRYNDFQFILDIYEGVRPNIKPETPEPLKKLIEECWDRDPKNRPDTNRIYNKLLDFIFEKNEGSNKHNFRKYTKQYDELEELSYEIEPLQSKEPDEYLEKSDHCSDVQIRI